MAAAHASGDEDGVGLEFIAEPAGARAVVVFVQGLHGELYGADGDAAPFIGRLRHDLPDAAQAICTYPTDLRRYRDNAALNVPELAALLADALRAAVLDRFENVAVVGHCLGGLLITMALPHVMRKAPDYLSRLRRGDCRLTYCLIDSPNDLPKQPLADIHKRLLEALRLPEDAVGDNGRYWREQVLERGPGQVPVNACAVVTTNPSWVTPLNPEAGLSATRVCRVSMPHEAIVKAPTEGSFEPYEFVLARLRDAGFGVFSPSD